MAKHNLLVMSSFGKLYLFGATISSSQIFTLWNFTQVNTYIWPALHTNCAYQFLDELMLGIISDLCFCTYHVLTSGRFAAAHAALDHCGTCCYVQSFPYIWTHIYFHSAIKLEHMIIVWVCYFKDHTGHRKSSNQLLSLCTSCNLGQKISILSWVETCPIKDSPMTTGSCTSW